MPLEYLLISKRAEALRFIQVSMKLMNNTLMHPFPHYSPPEPVQLRTFEASLPKL
jgi:hypothetical protein